MRESVVMGSSARKVSKLTAQLNSYSVPGFPKMGGGGRGGGGSNFWGTYRNVHNNLFSLLNQV